MKLYAVQIHLLSPDSQRKVKKTQWNIGFRLKHWVATVTCNFVKQYYKYLPLYTCVLVKLITFINGVLEFLDSYVTQRDHIEDTLERCDIFLKFRLNLHNIPQKHGGRLYV